MKKTLIALLALAGMASATEFTADTASGILYRDANGEFTTTSGVTFDNNTNKLTFDDKFGTSSRTTYTLGVLLDMSKVTLPETADTIVTTGTGTAMGIGITSSKELATVWGNDVPWVNGGNPQKAAAITSTGLVTLVHSTGNSGSVYLIEGQDFGSGNYAGWGWSGLKGAENGMNSFVLDSDFKDAIVAVGVWSTATVYLQNTAANKLELQGNMADISNTLRTISTPEPATATLSLLALAGLVSRRRRH